MNEKMKIIAPTRMHDYYSEGGYFSMSDSVNFFSKIGFDGIDVSLENISRFDESLYHVLYSVAKSAALNDIELSASHLSFFMPPPDSDEFKKAYMNELYKGIDATNFMGINLAAIHPVAYRESKKSFSEWLIKNVEFLYPLSEYASKKNVTLCIENMPSQNERKDHLYGSNVSEIRALAEIFDMKICFDFGHANVTGLDIPSELSKAHGVLGLIHVHDNNGESDSHMIPYNGNINWRECMNALKDTGYDGPFELEIKTSHMGRDMQKRDMYARLALMKGQMLTEMLK